MALTTRRHVHDISTEGTIFFLLNALIGAYNRRTDVLAKAGGGDNSQLLTVINNLDRKVDRFMATQEERLQAILVAVKTVKQMLADLKTNNPAIEDEIAAIESELAPAAEPTPEG